jgi:hypothetical protein
MNDFIAVYPGMIAPAACKMIIDRFNSSNQVTRGRTISGVDLKLKDSFDLTLTNRPDWQDVEQLFFNAAFVGLKDYIRNYPFMMIGALALKMRDPQTGELRLIDQSNFNDLSDETFTQLVMMSFRSGGINLQKYLGDQGGYPHWHSEICPRDSQDETLHRVLLYTFYLNSVPEAGETEFHYQNRKIKPEVGTLIFAPAGFTHTHRGNKPIGGDKYIATSWVLFNRAENLYRQPNPTK